MNPQSMVRFLWIPLLAIGSLTAYGCASGPGAGSPSPSAQSSSAQSSEAVWSWDTSDPRLGLAPGGEDAESASHGMELIAHMSLPDGFDTNSDLAFGGDFVFVGNYNGFNIYDISDPMRPSLRTSILCPGNQGDLSIHGNLLFKSVQASSSRLDCGTQGIEGEVSPERFRGVRIFDITNIDQPRQVAAVQTCRGSHTHSLASRPGDDDHIYVYVSGTSRVRPGEELEGCSGAPADEDPETSRFQIEVIRVPLAAPEQAAIVNEPRVFADMQSGEIAALRGLQRDGSPSNSPISSCHDITTYPAIGLAGGACSGNGLLLDISDPENPVRIDEVADANFAYWHSATFNNDGTKVIFTDEWGGGGAPRCREIDPPEWGGNAIFDLVDGELVHRSYYKLPVPIEPTCVAHNGSLVPVPGRDIKVQSWYEGGISMFDFTDSENPIEIAFFNRGPSTLDDGGFWSAYWYNGHVYGSELGRGLDVFRLVPNEHLSENEIEAAMSVRMESFNAQHQPRFEWPASFAVSRSYLDQLERAGAMSSGEIADLRRTLDEAEGVSAETERAAAADRLEAAADGVGADTRLRGLLAESLRDLAGTLR